MPPSATVLLFGSDSHLLKTRRWLVESSGFTVFTADNFLSLNQIFTEHSVDVLILCHSLSFEECERAGAIAKAHSPKTKVLVLVASDVNVCAQKSDEVVNIGAGPKTLLDAVEQLAKGRIPPEPDPSLEDSPNEARSA